ncbi:hypothetical protein ACQCVP_16760 [Rossellomorea vietnamensis]|uniref:hypothetical protein n=1 Tax=Rossellomorea vietnamensis TaxID=218284 RepID=UPI003CE9B0B6
MTKTDIKVEDGKIIIKGAGRRSRINLLPTPNRTTRLSDKSTSKMSKTVQDLNHKVLQFIHNQ